MKKGKRKAVYKANKVRMEEVSRILEELDYLAVELIKYSIKNQKTINKDEIKTLAQERTEMPIGDLEVSLIWSKINDFERRANELRKKGENNAEKTFTPDGPDENNS